MHDYKLNNENLSIEKIKNENIEDNKKTEIDNSTNLTISSKIRSNATISNIDNTNSGISNITSDIDPTFNSNNATNNSNPINNITPQRTFKIIVLGESNVGKSSLFLRYTQDLFREALSNTIGIDNSFKEVVIDGNPVMLQLWDTAGQERFRSIVSSYYREADGIVFVYDVTTERSFDYMIELIEEMKGTVDMKYAVVVGNKIDCANPDELKSSEQNIRILGAKYGISSYFCSAKTGVRVNEVFEDLAHKLYIDNSGKNIKKRRSDIRLGKKMKSHKNWKRFWCL